MTTLSNLTPHEIVIMGEDGREIIRLFPTGTIARVAVQRVKTGVVPLVDDPTRVLAGEQGAIVPVYVSTYGQVENLPTPQVGTIYVVSTMVRQAVPTRRDVLSPGELVRDSKGQPIGCRGLEANW